MTNYENQKERIDAIAEKGCGIAINKDTGEISSCGDMYCNLCLFHSAYDNIHCQVNAMKWAAEEYKEPRVDWSKVPVDTPVLASTDSTDWFPRYFAGVDEKGEPTVFGNGATQWSNENDKPCYFKYIKLAEVE